MKTFQPFGVSATLNLLPLQKQFISQNSGNQRFLYNHLWAEIKDKNLTDKVKFKANTYIKNPETEKRESQEVEFEVPLYSEKYLRYLHKKIEEENEFLSLSPISSKQMTISTLNQAIINGFKKIHSMPVFKKKYVSSEGFTIYNQNVKAGNGIQYLPERSAVYVPEMKTYINKLGINLSKKEIQRLTEFHIKENKKNRGKTFLPGALNRITFKLNSAGQYFVSTLESKEVEDSQWMYKLDEPRFIRSVGIDLGFKDKIVDSRGDYYKRIKFRVKYEDKIKKLQRTIAKMYEVEKTKHKQEKTKHKQGVITSKTKKKKEKNIKRLEKNPLRYEKLLKSEKTYLEEHTSIVKNYSMEREFYDKVNIKAKKLKERLARVERKIANKRSYENHKLSKTIVRYNDIIVLENLNILGMSKLYGRQVLDLALSDLVGKIKYKADIQGKLVLQVDRFFPSSKLCHCCGHKHTKLKLSDRTWTCESCGTELDRDVNAAINLEAEGLRILIEKIKAGEDMPAAFIPMEAKNRLIEEFSSRKLRLVKKEAVKGRRYRADETTMSFVGER